MLPGLCCVLCFGDAVQGGLADGEDARGELHRVLHARGHAAEGA